MRDEHRAQHWMAVHQCLQAPFQPRDIQCRRTEAQRDGDIIGRVRRSALLNKPQRLLTVCKRQVTPLAGQEL